VAGDGRSGNTPGTLPGSSRGGRRKTSKPGPEAYASPELSLAERLYKACEENSRVPAHNHGRQAWVRAQLAERCGVEVSSETISKWFTGVARPRPEKITALARVLDVDEAWLTLGVSARVGAVRHQLRNAMADGVVNVVAGFIQMAGGHPAFPESAVTPHEPGCAKVDLYAIIKGAHYAFHIVVAQETGPGVWRFVLDHGYESCLVLGVIPYAPLACDFIELRDELVARHGGRRKGVVEIVVERQGDHYHSDGEAWPAITSFAERL
jgi:transcriptional regulator with XRE-family HTH domain